MSMTEESTNGPPPAETAVETFERLRREVADLTSDLQKIAQSILEECINREWCSDYDAWARDLNSRLSKPCLHLQERTGTARFEVYLEYRGSQDDIDEAISEIEGRLVSARDDLVPITEYSVNRFS